MTDPTSGSTELHLFGVRENSTTDFAVWAKDADEAQELVQRREPDAVVSENHQGAVIESVWEMTPGPGEVSPTGQTAGFPGIIVLSDDSDDTFKWLSDGWNADASNDRPRDAALMAKARAAIALGDNVPDTIARLELAGFHVRRADDRIQADVADYPPYLAEVDWSGWSVQDRGGNTIIESANENPLRTEDGVREALHIEKITDPTVIEGVLACVRRNHLLETAPPEEDDDDEEEA